MAISVIHVVPPGFLPLFHYHFPSSFRHLPREHQLLGLGQTILISWLSSVESGRWNEWDSNAEHYIVLTGNIENRHYRCVKSHCFLRILYTFSASKHICWKRTIPRSMLFTIKKNTRKFIILAQTMRETRNEANAAKNYNKLDFFPKSQHDD